MSLHFASQQVPTVAADTRLDHRWIDLRTPANQAIFKIQSAVCQYFRANLASKVFVLKLSAFHLLWRVFFLYAVVAVAANFHWIDLSGPWS